ncbi:hypothetical protein GIB67_005949 [Kingdonia uniflora]|uniref:GED domain-containing protein n=1 Tax=Kingdonia uniflora TaxID=39325 RepID=A0A7J7MBN2_9MAGN|nr:hypothetical protein GIB67_005949 [Kingdonia uniflora]
MSRIPGIQSLINKSIAELLSELSRLENLIATDTRLVFSNAGKATHGHGDESRSGGDKIYNVFDKQLPAALKRLQFDKQLSMENVRKLITEADGYQPHLIASEQGYCYLIESSLVIIRGPAEAAVDTVHAILKELVRKAISDTAVSSLDMHYGCTIRMRDESKKTTLKLVDVKSSYLTVDFFRKLPQDVEKGSTVLAYVNMVCGSLLNSIPNFIIYCQVFEAKCSLLDHVLAGMGKKEAKQLSSLLNEDPTVMERRFSLSKRLKLYRSAEAEIDVAAWAK